MSITVDVDASSFSRYLKSAMESASPTETRKYLKNAGVVILKMEAGIFKSDGADLGKRWDALKPATIAIRKKRRNLRGKRATGMQILRDTRSLEWSVGKGSAERGPTGALRELRPLEIKIGTRLKYAATHQYGRPAMRVRVPQSHRKGYNVRGHRVAARSVLAHTYKNKKGTVVNVNAYTIRSHSVRAHGVLPGTVKAHETTWGKVPARPFVGWTHQGVEYAVAEAYRHFCEAPDQRTR